MSEAPARGPLWKLPTHTARLPGGGGQPSPVGWPGAERVLGRCWLEVQWHLPTPGSLLPVRLRENREARAGLSSRLWAE